MNILALFEVDDNGEATGRVFHFCGDNDCRSMFKDSFDGILSLKEGVSRDAVQGSVCDFCMKEIGK